MEIFRMHLAGEKLRRQECPQTHRGDLRCSVTRPPHRRACGWNVPHKRAIQRGLILSLPPQKVFPWNRHSCLCARRPPLHRLFNASCTFNNPANLQFFSYARIRAPGRPINMNRPRIFALLAIATAIGASTTLISKLSAADDHSGHFKFRSDSIVLTRSVYVGTASTVTTGETLPLGCPGGPNGSTVVAVPTTTNGTTDVIVPCGVAS